MGIRKLAVGASVLLQLVPSDRPAEPVVLWLVPCPEVVEDPELLVVIRE
jgi:hypothetical protein